MNCQTIYSMLLVGLASITGYGANPGGPPTVGTISIGNRGVVDHVEVTVGPGEVVFLEIEYDTYSPLYANTFGAGEDTAIGLYDSEGTLIVENDDSFYGSQTSVVRASDLKIGSYFLAVGIGDVTFGPNFDAVSKSKTQATLDVTVGSLPFYNGGSPVKLNYNFNGMVHEGEGMSPDDPDGFRSISDRALDFRNGLPNDPLFFLEYNVVSEAGQLDLVHLGNRNSTNSGQFAFDESVDGDCIGVTPNWLPDPDQTGRNVTFYNDTEFISFFSHIGVLYQIDGGGSFDLIVELTNALDYPCGEVYEFRKTITGPDWLGGTPNIGTFSGSVDSDCGTPDPAGENNLTITETIIDLTDLVLELQTDLIPKSISFESAEPDASVAILGCNIGFAGVIDFFGIPGDMNFDFEIDILDVAPFVDAIVLGEYNFFADVNGDCEVNLSDVHPFVQLLIGN